MKSQSIQLFLLMVAICALMVTCMPAGKLTEEEKKFLSKESNYGAQEWNAHGYGSQSNQSISYGTKHSTSGSQPLNVQGLGYQSSEHVSRSRSGQTRHSNHDQIKAAYYEHGGHKH
ncbi:uncharacterized protein FA14DRAFT_174441 [Meira miltonrushii]|uniref:Secreted protein n=1 Tax=Meira miltonrushii TaxID=1280837 RepID=A0A316V5A6_9BASI|nr:uncharacterized protein FA14DRAFT_174441 [Meira miltonrushii]PWN32759.1 hypothetical protein FA14DRAFT_174441 [Meira miltonrushii]